MKVLAIGDPHGKLDKIKKLPLKNIDLILLTGDLGKADLARKIAFENIERRKRGLSEKEYSASIHKKVFMETYTSTIKLIVYLSKFAPVYTIFGNVEMSDSEIKKLSAEMKQRLPLLTSKLNSIKNVKIINNKLVHFNGLKIGGLEYFLDKSWVREFKPSDLKEMMKEAKKETSKAQKILSHFEKLNILVCHQPPYKILDKVNANFVPKHWQGKHAGSKAILDYIKRRKPKYVFCGHIHEERGVKKLGPTEIHNLGVCGHKIVEF